MIDLLLFRKLYPKQSDRFGINLQVMPSTYIPVVTQFDYENKFITRYFLRMANDATFIIEVDKRQYEEFKQNPRFIYTTLQWKIVGKKDSTINPENTITYGVIDINRQATANADLTFGGLQRYIKDYAQFWVAEV